MNELTKLANKYLSDKGTVYDAKHNYTEAYFKEFGELKDKELNILEIGILGGASAMMWKDFFTNSQIYCCDVVQNYIQILEWEDRIRPFYMDQSNRESIKLSMGKLVDFKTMKAPQFDIIVDDGSHQIVHQQITLGMLFPYLKSGGIYVLEDLHTSLNPDYLDESKSYEYSTLNTFKMYEANGEWWSQFMNEEELKYLNENTKSSKVYGWENERNKENMSITSIIRKK